MKLQGDDEYGKCHKEDTVYAVVVSGELIMCHSSQLCIYCHPVGSLKLSMVEQFTPRKLASTTNQGFLIFFGLFVFPQRASW